MYFGKPITCLHNPVIGRERELAEWQPAATKKKVLVIGGGPGGLEAARMAALRGHEVILYERTDRLGGQVLLSANAPKRESMADITGWLVAQLRKVELELRLGSAASVETVLAEQPDAVIVATGSRPYRPKLPGFDAPHVVSSWEVLSGAVETGQRVLIVDDDAIPEIGPSVADYLAGARPAGRGRHAAALRGGRVGRYHVSGGVPAAVRSRRGRDAARPAAVY